MANYSQWLLARKSGALMNYFYYSKLMMMLKAYDMQELFSFDFT